MVEKQTKYTAKYDRKTIYRGDTLDGMNVTVKNTETGEPVIPEFVCAELVNGLGKKVYTFSSETNPVSGKVFIDPIPASITKDFFPGVYRYDVEYTLADGKVRTYLQGEVVVLGDISTCQSS